MTETILDHTSSLDGLLERLLPDPRLRGKESERAANTPRRLPVLHPSICALDAVYSIVHRYGLFDDYKAAINKGFIENYCNYYRRNYAFSDSTHERIGVSNRTN